MNFLEDVLIFFGGLVIAVVGACAAAVVVKLTWLFLFA